MRASSCCPCSHRTGRAWTTLASALIVTALVLLLCVSTGASAAPTAAAAAAVEGKASVVGVRAGALRERGAPSDRRAVPGDDLEYFPNVLHERAVDVDFTAPSARVASVAEDSNTNTTEDPVATTTTTSDPNKPWTAAPPPDGYPEGSSTYTRREPQAVKVGFFIKCWYVAIIILVIGVAVLYVLLCVWIYYHFDTSDQNKARKVVQRSYEEKGYFDLDNASRGSSVGSMQSYASRSHNANTYEMNMANGMTYMDADSVSVGNANPLNGDDYYA